MVDIKATENEFRSQLTSWLNGYFQAGNYPFESATNDVSVAVEDTHLFIDVVLWLNREAKLAFCLFELKTPETAVHDSALLENARVKANALKVKYFVTWNMQELVIWEIKDEGRGHAALPKRYPTLDMIQKADDWTVDYKRRALETLCKELVDDLAWLHKYEHITRIPLDARFFVGRLRETADKLFPLFAQTIKKKLGEDKKLRAVFETWGKKQGVQNPLAQIDTVSNQAVYRLLCKIIFYEALRGRYNLKPLALMDVDARTAQQALRERFAEAKNIDWYAVFEEELIDELPWPDLAVPEISGLLERLETYSFHSVPQDVIGKVFEGLIPHQERHGLGQYFTPENLVDFILAFCVQTPNDAVFDPTCGTGTFLIRGYDRLGFLGNQSHRKRLVQLWGNDIAHFPAALATINLFGQDLGDTANFPRIIPKDFFDINPGDVFPFPPPTGPTEAVNTIDVPMPEFDAAVGNFPYIRQELTGNKEKINTVITRDWPGFAPRLSGQADVYASMFFHAAVFLKTAGRLGFVTSNAWLDTAYGYEIQKFFLDEFKLVAVVESRREPWFEQAAVNTVFTILERCENAEERENHIAKFVKVRRPLKDMFPHDPKLKQRERWQSVEGRARAIENAGNDLYEHEAGKIVCTLQGLKSAQNGDFRIRMKNQRELREELKAAGRTVKWGQYLRAPDIYFEIKKALGDKLRPFKEFAEIDFGIKTGINDFFYLTREEAKEKGIEKEYLTPVFKSPRDSDKILVEPEDLKVLLFNCRETKEILKKKKHNGALKYIEEGEGRRTAGGVPYPEVPSVKDNKPGWWAVREFEPAQIFFAKGYDVKLSGYFSENPIGCDCRVYYVRPLNNIAPKLLGAALDSGLVYLLKELIGRVMLGEGVLDIMVLDYDNYLKIPDINRIEPPKQKNIIKAFEKLIIRPVKPVPAEFKEPDRRALDTAILEALGLEADKYLEPLYAGVTELVRERLDLAGQRKKIKKESFMKDVTRVQDDVVRAVLPWGFKPFPDAYVTYGRGDEFRMQSLGNGPFKLGAYFLGGREVLDREGRLMVRAASEEEARFVFYSFQPDVYTLKIPNDAVKVHNAVVDHEKYLKDKFEELYREFTARLGSGAAAERLTRETFEEYGIPVIFSNE